LLSIELADKVIRGKRPTPTSTINSRKYFTISWLQNITPEFFLEKNTTFSRFFKVLFAVVPSNSTCDDLPLKFSPEGCRQNHRRHPQLSGRHHPLQKNRMKIEEFLAESQQSQVEENSASVGSIIDFYSEKDKLSGK
jgi:hypothetical protein